MIDQELSRNARLARFPHAVMLQVTDYDFGFNEWYFSERSHDDLFLDFVTEINWGENYPK